MPENKRKKHHDKDKYYRLAKEQGLRSRAAFKLVQINRKFHFLENAKVVLDLCAAPGGWTQIASRTMSSAAGRGGGKAAGKKGSSPNPADGHVIVAVDILPIRHIGQNVITLVGDITTNECHAKIKQTLSGASADVVLCDGAPNVGANYDRDAYAQNDIALMSLKCATSHLREHGTFVTKLYRSRDYNSYLWVVRQLFREVKAVKPVSSRAQSAEIFLVCLGYKAPDKIDPKLLDSKSVFEQLYDEDGHEIDAANGTKSQKGITVFHKQWDSQSKGRRRQGYDMTNKDATMRNIGTVSEFVNSPDPIQLLTDCTGFTFLCSETCSNQAKKKDDDEEMEDTDNVAKCPCRAYLEHHKTTGDVKACLADLKVLNKSDFKNLIAWRLKMQVVRDEHVKQQAAKGGVDDASSDGSQAGADKDDVDRELDSEEEEERIQKEIVELRERKMRQKKKVKKKEREEMAKRRKRAALGMDLNAVDVPEHDQIFTLATIGTKGELEAVREIDLDQVPKKLMEGDEEEEEEHDALEVLQKMDARELSKLRNTPAYYHEEDENEEDLDQATGYSYRLDREMDSAYHLYLSKTNNKAATSGTRMEKRQKTSRKKQMLKEAEEDNQMIEKATTYMVADETKRYAALLDGANRDSDDEDDSGSRLP
jgi:AdoMet-dependent rRNA methyltransferase SPB1